MTKRKSETKEEFNKRRARYMSGRYFETVEFVRLYKTEKGCKDCGYNEHHAGLQFDHVIPRSGDDSKIISRLTARGIATVMKYITEECEVVCSRCHSIRTWNRAQGITGL